MLINIMLIKKHVVQEWNICRIELKNASYLHTGHFQFPLSTLNLRYDSRSRHCMCLQSCPRAGILIFRYVMGHFNDTLIAVCSTPSSTALDIVVPLAADVLKLYLIFFMQCSAGSNRFFRRPWRTELTEGRCTSCRTNRWEQQQTITFTCMVLRPGIWNHRYRLIVQILLVVKNNPDVSLWGSSKNDDPLEDARGYLSDNFIFIIDWLWGNSIGNAIPDTSTVSCSRFLIIS